MKKKANSQDYILFSSFKLFLNKNFKDVTIADIEKEIGMSRGAIFYYYKDKNELFKSVIDKFIIDKQSTSKIIAEAEITSLKSFIDSYVSGIKRSMEVIRAAKVKNILRCYFNLINNAVDQYPGFDKSAYSIILVENETWEKYIQKGIKNEELKASIDVNISAKIFQSIFYGLSYMTSLNSNEEVLDTNLLYSSLISYYNTIKKE